MQKITPFLWFDRQAEEAADFYTSVFKNSKKGKVLYSSEAGPADGPLEVTFELEGLEFTALNGGPQFKFTEAVSFMIDCKDQAEVDYYWEKLGEGGTHQPCGWLKDKFGVSWQITPGILLRFIADPNSEKAARVMQAMLQMTKIDIATLERAYAG
jgi:predicted 3-demethylubiquinone-9 3-methyltransferase (glyoxalase superfamily)